jgi:hypothetical protein
MRNGTRNRAASHSSLKLPWLFCAALYLAALTGCGGGSSANNATPGLVSLSSVLPVRGSTLGGTVIKVNGQGFSAGTRAEIGGQDCKETTALDSSSLVCVTPAHTQGDVDLQVINPDGGRATLPGAYSYRPSGTGIASFGILAAGPLQGAYPDPFSAALESVITGFDLSTTTRSWVVDGKPYNEGDTVAFETGSHTVNLTVRDATGDSDSASYAIVVGQRTDLNNRNLVTAATVESTGNTFVLSPGKSISVVNTGLFPVLNPRLIGVGKPDYVDWPRYLRSLVDLSGLPMDASEGSRAMLLEAAWKDLSNATTHVCSPGRESEFIIDPVMLVRGYGYECCSNASRALAFLGSFLDIPARVRSTYYHEFPEFTVAGNMFVLDPDLRFRFWGDNLLPLSAWTTGSTSESLQNVTRYYAQTPTGGYFETQSGGTLPYGSVPQFPEQDIRAWYFTDIIRETLWGYHEAFSWNANHVLFPNEKVAYRRSSTYIPLQSRNSDGTPTGGSYAPAVGKVMFRQLWSANGPRTLQQDGNGNRVIRLNDLPYPVQDLVFHFSKPVNPKDFWLTAAGKTYRIGDFTANSWTVSDKQLRVFSNVSDLAAVVSQDQNLIAVDVGMQFNPGIFGDPSNAVSLRYVDDSGTCQHRLSVTTGGDMKEVTIGSSLCDTRAPQRVQSSYALKMGEPGVSVISSYGNSYQGTWGLYAASGVHSYAEVSLPRTPGLPGMLRATNEGFFADWQIHDGANWTPLSTIDMTSQWIELPASSSSTALLRVTLRSAPAGGGTYLSYLSLIEGQASGWPFYVGTPTAQRSE